MPGRLNEVGEQYSLDVALVYVFNLIVGTGALTMPHAISESGWIIGVVMIVFIAFMSFLTVTFTIECMASSNALSKWTLQQRQSKKQDKAVADDSDEIVDGQDEIEPTREPSRESINGGGGNNANAASTVIDDEQHPLLDRSPEKERQSENDYFEITERIEMGEMASMFFKRAGVITFYIIIIVYLYGDLAIYGAAVPKSLRDVICDYNKHNESSNVTKNDLIEADPCFKNNIDGLSRWEVYLCSLSVFFVLQLPFVFFNAQKTKWLQIITSALRWISFLMMISIAIWRAATREKALHPPLANIEGIPTLFGASIYSFMCHHSLPSLISPVKNKSRVTALFIGDYVLIMFFYILMCMTAVYAFDPLQDLYTLNFAPNSPDAVELPGAWIWVKYFIALFPVFTISTSFPIIAITLRNNLKTLFQPKTRPYHKCVERVLFPFVTIVPPIVLVYFTNDVALLVGITGAYAGAGIQYLLPAILVLVSRRHMSTIFGTAVRNKHQSPFGHVFWVWFTVAWCCVALIFVTWDLINKHI